MLFPTPKASCRGQEEPGWEVLDAVWTHTVTIEFDLFTLELITKYYSNVYICNETGENCSQRKSKRNGEEQIHCCWAPRNRVQRSRVRTVCLYWGWYQWSIKAAPMKLPGVGEKTKQPHLRQIKKSNNGSMWSYYQMKIWSEILRKNWQSMSTLKLALFCIVIVDGSSSTRNFLRKVSW